MRGMWRRAVWLASVLATGGSLAASDLLDASRSAISGGRPLPAIHGLTMTGRLRLTAERDAMLDGTVEIQIELPRRYTRIDTIGSTRRISGFDRDQVLTSGPGRPAERLRDERAKLARLMLGIAAAVVTDEHVEMQFAGDEAFPDTRAVDLTTKSWSLRYVMDKATSMPMRIVFFGGSRGTTITSFADRRDVDGYQLPHRITTTTSERVLETLMFDEILVKTEGRKAHDVHHAHASHIHKCLPDPRACCECVFAALPRSERPAAG